MGSPLVVTDTVFSGGQNEGVDRSILPLPQLAYVQNARMRKVGRWGKRFGTSVLPTTNRNGITLGNGTGNTRSVGPGFCVVDDQCVTFDGSISTWIDPKTVVPVNAANSWIENGRIPGAISGWLPDTAYFPVPPKSQFQQHSTCCAQAYMLNVLWTCIQFTDPINTSDQMLRVVGTDVNQTVVFLADFRAATAANGGLVYPKLVVCGSTLVLTYLSQLGAGAPTLSGRRLTSVLGGFSAEATLIIVPSTCVYDCAPHSSTDFLLTYTFTGAGPTVGVAFVTASSFAFGATRSFTDLPTSFPQISVTGASGTPIYVTYGTHNAAGPVDATRVKVFDSALSALVGTATVSSATSVGGYSSLLPGGGVRTVFGLDATTPNEPVFFYRDVTAAGALAGSIGGKQWRMQPISRPITIGTQVYIWCTNTDFQNSFGYAHLLRLPAISEFSGTFSGGYHALSCPVEMSAQDFLIATTPPSVDQKGMPAITQIGSTATYAACMPVLINIPDVGASSFSREFRVIQAKHYTDSPAYRSVMPIAADGIQLLPGGVLTRIDTRSYTEEGFFIPPCIALSSVGGGGSLTASSTYLYSAVYRARNANGRYELSGPAAPFTVNLGAGQTSVSLQLATLEVSARENVQLEIYRTQGNGTIYQLLDIIDGGIQPTGLGYYVYVDVLADSTIKAREVLYTQVGQTLANAPPPPCRFGAAGGQRVYLGGLLRGDTAHASKSLLGDQSPTWCDNDAFRIIFPNVITGLAWMDNLIGFTNEGIYVVTGDGPDDSGSGQFSPPIRLPFALGCIEPRSVITVDEGTFFRTSRGLYLLPRGFGSPIPAGDVVMDTLANYPIIVGSAVVNKGTEQTIRWSCVDTAAAVNGVQIVYDLAHKVWSVDVLSNASVTNAPQTAIGQWLNGELIMTGPSISTTQIIQTNSSYSDPSTAISMVLRTGDIRPFGLVGHAVIEKLGLMAELRSACTLSITRTSDRGSSSTTRVFSGTGPDYVVGQTTYTEASLSAVELRDITALSLQFLEASTTEGLAITGLILQHEAESQGFKNLKIADRVT